MSIPYKFIGFGLTLLAPAHLSAQDKDGQDDANVIVVTGEGLEQAASTAAYAVTEIDRETIQSAARQPLIQPQRARGDFAGIGR